MSNTLKGARNSGIRTSVFNVGEFVIRDSVLARSKKLIAEGKKRKAELARVKETNYVKEK